MIPLRDAVDVARYGGKAAGLAAALAAGLPVPDGIAVGWSEQPTRDQLAAAIADLGAVAVRSSAVDEDGALASFAGQHKTVINPSDVLAAVRDVEASARSASALAYRAKLGLSPATKMAVVIQRLVDPITAGVMFTRHPVTGADEYIVEASWGLGEAIVSSLVDPDRFRWRRNARSYEVTIGDKDTAIRPTPGGVTEVAVDPAMRRARTLSDEQLAELAALAERCERYAGAALDLEWAYAASGLCLLQCRKLTR